VLPITVVEARTKGYAMCIGQHPAMKGPSTPFFETSTIAKTIESARGMFYARAKTNHLPPIYCAIVMRL